MSMSLVGPRRMSSQRTSASLAWGGIGSLKKALERYWAKKSDAAELLDTARRLREGHWRLQHESGLAQVPCNDFSLYDHVLDTAVMVGLEPERFKDVPAGLDRYFAMARGVAHEGERSGAAALEMTKWFDTNYHYLVPEFEKGQEFLLASDKPLVEFSEARALGITPRPVLLGPVSFLLLGKAKDPDLEPLDLWPALVPVYEDLLRRLASAGAEWVQIDEPCLVTDLDAARLAGARFGLQAAGKGRRRLEPSARDLLRRSRSGPSGRHATARQGGAPRPRAGTRSARGGDEAGFDRSDALPRVSSTGGTSGVPTSIAALEVAEKASERLGADRVMLAPSCSLLHVPFDLDDEAELDPELRSWLAFARQKLDEVALLARALEDGRDAVAAALEENRAALASRRRSSRTKDPAVRRRLADVSPTMFSRSHAYNTRRKAQRARTPLPLLPTTTIGSFPQTDDVRKARAAHRSGTLPSEEYATFLKAQVEDAIRWQEEVGLDVLVHGEFERNDMVEYFGENLDGFAFTANGWVQSYGSRCVKPPIIFGDVKRRGPMTVEWARYAQSLTTRPVKGMLTGPVTILQWSFVRDDQTRSGTCRQIALAIRDEVADLEAAGIAVIQIDEPALREGLPLRRRSGRSTCAGRSMPSGSPRPAYATRRRSIPTCATASSTTSSTRSRRWTRT